MLPAMLPTDHGTEFMKDPSNLSDRTDFEILQSDGEGSPAFYRRVRFYHENAEVEVIVTTPARWDASREAARREWTVNRGEEMVVAERMMLG